MPDAPNFLHGREEFLVKAWRTGWAPRDRSPTPAWAREHVYLPNCYAIQGWFHVEKSRYLLEPFAAIDDDQVRVVTIQAGIQTGKSLLGDITVCHTIVTHPTHLLWNFPTDEAADRYAERRALPLLEACPEIARQFAQNFQGQKRHKKKKNEIHFGPMWLAIQGANEGNLQTYTVPLLINEELWEWTPGMYIHAQGRTSYYQWRSKIVNLSQAGDAGSDQDQQFKAGTMEEWHVPCPHCHFYHPQLISYRTGRTDSQGKEIWAGLRWDTNEHTRPGGIWNFDAMKATIRYVCPNCLEAYFDEPKTRLYLNDHGHFVVTNPNASREHRSFHWPSLACPEVRFATIAEEFLRAKDQEKVGNRIPIAEFYKKRDAISYDPQLHTTYDLLPTILLSSEKKWEKQDFIFMAVDVQRDHFWGLVQAWSKYGESIVLWAGKFLAWDDIARKQRDFEVPDRCVFIDSAYRTNEVYMECVRHGHLETAGEEGGGWISWNAVRGDFRDEFIYTHRIQGPTGGSTTQRIRLPYSWPPSWADPCLGLDPADPDRLAMQGRFCPLFFFAKGQIDQMAFERREMMKRGQTCYLAPGPWRDEFSRQMEGEQEEIITSPLGHTKRKSKKVGPNHLLDCFRICLMAACIAGIIGPARPA